MPLCLLSLSDLARPHRTRNIGVVECVHTRSSGRWRPTESGYDGDGVRLRARTVGLGGALRALGSTKSMICSSIGSAAVLNVHDWCYHGSIYAPLASRLPH